MDSAPAEVRARTARSEQRPLSACRSRAGLEYLGLYTGALAGVLYLHKAHGLTRSASLGEADASAELDAWTCTYFAAEFDAGAVTQVHGELPDHAAGGHTFGGNRHYLPVLLTHIASDGAAVTGVAMLRIAEASAFTYPRRIAVLLSRAVADAGDALASVV